jgi:hypothetical protein
MMAAGAKIGVRLIAMVIGIPVSIATRKLVESAWHAARPEDPPRKPSEAGVRWADAVAWGAMSAAGVVVADLVTRRSAEATYRVVTGNEPPPLKKSKAEKKAAASRKKAGVTEK